MQLTENIATVVFDATVAVVAAATAATIEAAPVTIVAVIAAAVAIVILTAAANATVTCQSLFRYSCFCCGFTPSPLTQIIADNS